MSQLKTVMREEATSHKKVYRPWGSYEGIDLSANFQVKRITVKPRSPRRSSTERSAARCDASS